MTVDAAVAALVRGGIVGLPTDTVYGIAADPRSEDAVAALFAAKGRPSIKPIPILAADLAAVRTIGVVDDLVAATAGRYWPGGLTLVVSRLQGSPPWLGDTATDTVGVRIPDHPAALQLLAEFGPLAVTSANLSGQDPASDDVEARSALGEAVDIYLEGQGSGGAPSTVVDVTTRPSRVLRPGAVEWDGP